MKASSTMQKEMQEDASAGHRYAGVMGGETAFGGSEVVVVMTGGAAPGRYSYRLLATNKTSTMQKQMQEAGDVILERDAEAPATTRYEYRLLATKKTSTLQKERSEAGDVGSLGSDRRML